MLGVSRSASEDDVKKAYRRLAKAHHPDSGRPGDVERFHQIQEAYETLVDPVKRRQYDGSFSGRRPVSWTGGFERPIEPLREKRPRRRAQDNVHLDIVLSPGEARRGRTVFLEVPQDVRCRRCGGQGREFFGWCVVCGGDGFLRTYESLSFVVPAGVSSGQILSTRSSGGALVRAQVFVRPR